MVKSPNGKNLVTTENGTVLRIIHNGQPLTTVTASMFDSKGVRSSKTSVIKETIVAPFYRQKGFESTANQLDLKLGRDFGLQVRAYDEGVAYRFYTTQKGETIIKYEIAHYDFHTAKKAWLAYSTNTEKPFAMAFQNTYHVTSLDSAKHTPAFLPVTLEFSSVPEI